MNERIVLTKCRCGKTPKSEKGRDQDGNCYISNYYIVCECGMRTRSFSLFVHETEEKCIEEATKVWNGVRSV
jgi:hypothetical protein